ncbi:uncharacterized protein LOC121876383 [Homarus americanus]|uniref:uncharacterized protein LOC121876383 n=1 Tax=Homarus americanus TaxID=6706 RepID=UPI001C47B725|nr:uncharacterized protein LOC121876383 [Homarus americanus]
MVEKITWTLGQELVKYCLEGQTEWDENLPAPLMAYGSAAHESTRYTPGKMMLGHELRLPVDLLTGRPPDEERTEETTSYVKSLQERLTKVHHKVRGALEFSGEVMKRNYDVKASLVCYKDGNKVWLYNPLRKKGQSPKYQSPWEGPYTSGAPFRCDLLDQGKKEGSPEGSPRQSSVAVSWARAVHLGRL